MKTVKKTAGGMTLIEMLVAFVILLMLVTALVTLTTRSLEVWTSGETRKDIYDRGQVVLDLVAADLRNVYTENEWYTDGAKALPAPALQGDLDKNNRPRIRFVRTGNTAMMRTPPGSPATILAPNYYGPMWEVAYVLDPDSAKNTLFRGLRGFDRRKSGTLLNPIEYSSATDSLFTSAFTPVEYGVLHVGFKYWTQFTTTWDDTVPIREVAKGRAKQSSGPEKRWDSTRKEDRSFYFYRKSNDLKDPDFVYPEIIQVSVTIEAGSPDLHGVKLGDPVDERSTYLHLTHTRGLPDPPGLIKVEGEWIEYGEKNGSDLGTLRRGQRGSKPVMHPVGAPVHFGETFVTEVRIPAYREAQEP